MMIMKHQHQMFTPAKAIEIAAMLNADADDGFEYRVRHDPKGTGLSVIEVYDEQGEYVDLF